MGCIYGEQVEGNKGKRPRWERTGMKWGKTKFRPEITQVKSKYSNKLKNLKRSREQRYKLCFDVSLALSNHKNKHLHELFNFCKVALQTCTWGGLEKSASFCAHKPDGVKTTSLHRRHDGTETFRLLQTVLEVHRASALTGGRLARGRPQTAPRWPSASLHGLRQTSAGQQLLRLPCLGVCPRLGYDAVFGYPGATNGSWTDVDDSRNLQEGQGAAGCGAVQPEVTKNTSRNVDGLKTGLCLCVPAPVCPLSAFWRSRPEKDNDRDRWTRTVRGYRSLAFPKKAELESKNWLESMKTSQMRTVMRT